MATLGPNEKAPFYFRLGIWPLGWSRLDYFNFVQFVTIGGSPVPSEALLRGSHITKTLGQPWTALLKIRASAFTPAAGQEVLIAFGSEDRKEFGGHILRPRETRLGTSQEYYYNCPCRDYTYKLNKRLVNAVYGGQLSSLMAQSVVDDMAADGFTFNALSAGNSIAGRTFKNTRRTDALNQIARADGASWRVTPAKEVRWWLGQEPGVQGPAPVVVGNVTYGALEWEPGDVSQIKTRIRVEGMDAQLTTAASAGQTSISLDETGHYSSGGGSAMVGSDEITYTGKTATTLTGIPASGAGSLLSSWGVGTKVALLVIVNDATAQTALGAVEGGDGTHEDSIVDGRLSIAGALERGQAELSRYAAVAAGAGSILASEDKFMEPGRQVTINLPARGINGTYLINEVVLRFRSPQQPVRDVRVGPYRADLIDLLASQTIPAGQLG